MVSTSRMLGALGVLVLSTGSSLAQPALVDWTCTAWRTVELTMLNPFGRECSQWTLRQPASLAQVPPPPLVVQRAQAAEATKEKAKPSKEPREEPKQKQKGGHAR